MNSKISVYGSTGFIGSRFVELYEEESIKLPRYQRNPETPNILYLYLRLIIIMFMMILH